MTPTLAPARRRRAFAAAFAGAAVAALLSGCSQVDALAQVSGVPEATLRIAANDLLLEQDVAILEAPVCRKETDSYRCEGTTQDGDPIEVIAPLTTPLTMTLTVGGTQLYSGDVQAVIDRNAEATS